MAIQMRRGEYDDFDASRMLAGELAVVVSGDPETEGGALYVATAAGNATRVAFADEVPTEDATTTSDGLMSAADKAKLDGVAAGAQANVIESVSVNGNSATVTGKAAAVTIPEATDAASGVMGAGDKAKLNGIEAGANAYTLPAATTAALGGVKPDGTTVTVDNDGTIHAAGSGTIPDGSVTTAKLADGAVTTGKLASNAVTTTTVQDGSITGVKIADDTIQDAKLAQTGGVLEDVGRMASINGRDMLRGIEFTQNSINVSDGATFYSATRIASDFIDLSGIESLTFTVESGYRYVMDWYDGSKTYLPTTHVYRAAAWQSETLTLYAGEFEGAGYLRVLVSNSNDTEIVPAESVNLHIVGNGELVSVATFASDSVKIDLSVLDWKRGSISSTTTSQVWAGCEISSNQRIRSPHIRMGKGSVVAVHADNPDVGVFLHYYDSENGAYLGNTCNVLTVTNVVVPYDCDVRILIATVTGTTFTADDIPTYVAKVSAYVTSSHATQKAAMVASNAQFSTSSVYFEEDSYGTGMWVKFGAMWLRGYLNNTSNWADVLTSLKATSPKGVTDCVNIPHNAMLVFDTSDSTYKIVDDIGLTMPMCAYTQIPVLVVRGQDVGGTLREAIIGGIGYHCYAGWMRSQMQSGSIDTSAATQRYAALVNDATETEQFVYFTDPHLMGASSDTASFRKNFDKYIETIKAYVDDTSTTFTMCGGDWLNNGDTAAVAKWKLGLIHGAGKRIGSFYGVVGNHDTNYQGSGTSPTLANQTINNAMFGGEHGNYYSFDGTNTRFYVIDSGIDSNAASMDSYRWEQVAWFANALKDDDKPHSAVSIHIWYTDYQDQTADTISALATNISSVIAAYNGRTTATLNGVTYDFSGCTGHMEFIICGHTHFDKSGTGGGVPVINTLNTQSGSKPSFDLVYADYDNRKVYTVRVGTGSDRTFNLPTI